MTELLSPCGGKKELKAAVYAGANAVYLGVSKFNARQSADNFSLEDIPEVVSFCHLHNVKVYITLNTIICDKEYEEVIPIIKSLAQAKVNGIIIQSLGLAQVIKNVCPSMPLHASTQLTVHSLSGVLFMAKIGFERVVLSRELSFENLKYICENSPIETEVFIHGALCMCYSGQCYLSSVIGTRSGNRGSCAQPCRKEYKNGYELSLKDLCMASDFEKFLSLGVCSLKIEGRLKNEQYVYGVTKTYRALIDEKRDATKKEIAFLTSLFSRQGFTNNYFNQNPSKEMFGIRTAEDKTLSQNLSFEIVPKKIPVHLEFFVKKGMPVKVIYSCNGKNGIATGDIPETAQKKGATYDEVKERLSKVGDTEFCIAEAKGFLDDGLFIPVSALNNLRRQALSALENALTERADMPFELNIPKVNAVAEKEIKYNIFLPDSKNIDVLAPYLNLIDNIFIPMDKIEENYFNKTSPVIFPIITDTEKEDAIKFLNKCKSLNMKKAYCRSWDGVYLAQENGFGAYGGFSLNLYSSFDLSVAKEKGLLGATLSSECNVNGIRNMNMPLKTSVIVYGHLPVMITENCIIKNAGKCINYNGVYYLQDKTNAKFPVICQYPHRNIILNSLPVNLSDKQQDFENLNLSCFDFFFTIETKEEIKQILDSFINKTPPEKEFTRGLYYRKI